MPPSERTPVVFVSLDGVPSGRDLSRRVLSLEVDEEVGKTTKIKLVFSDIDGLLRERETLQEGQTLGVRWGYHGTLSAPRGGIIHRVDPRHEDDRIEVEALGRELSLSVGPVRRVFRGATFRGAVTELARDAGLRMDWQAPEGIRFDAQTIDNQHVWQWLLARTGELGLEVLVEGDALVVREPRLSGGADQVLHFRWKNGEVLSFEVETQIRRHERRDAGAVALFTDPATGEALSHAAGDPNTTRAVLAARRTRALAAQRASRAAEEAGQRAYVASHPEAASQSPAAQRAAYAASRAAAAASPSAPTEDDPHLLVNLASQGYAESFGEAPPAAGSGTQATVATRGEVESHPVAAPAAAARTHLRQVSEGRFRAHERGRVKGKVTCLGLPLVRTGRVVQIVGVAPRDGGLWYVEKALHKVEGSYTTELELKRNGPNGRHGARPSPAAQANTAPATSGAPQAEATVAVRLGDDGAER